MPNMINQLMRQVMGGPHTYDLVRRAMRGAGGQDERESDLDYRNRMRGAIGSAYGGVMGDPGAGDPTNTYPGNVERNLREQQNTGETFGGLAEVGGQGYTAPYGKQGPGSRGYYRGVPTAWNAEITKPTYYNYTGDPDPAKMARRPWDPSFWDPNHSSVPGSRGRAPAAALEGRQDRGRMSMNPRFAAWIASQMGGR